MKRGGSVAVCLIALAVCCSCSLMRHVQSDPLSESELAGYAGDHFYMEGVRMYNNGKYDAAMDLMSRSLDYDTASAATCYGLAQFYMSIRDRSLAAKYIAKTESLLLKAVRLEPDNYWYRRLLALNYMRQNRHKEAVAEYEEIARRFPGRTDVLITLASLYDDAGEYEKELRVLKRYGQLEDVDEELKFQRFACYLQMNELDSAYYESDDPAAVIELLMNTTKDLVEHAETQIDKMQCRTLLDLAMNFCDVVAAHEPSLMQAYSQKALAYFWLNRNDEAMDILAKGLRSVRTDMDKAALYGLRSDFYNALGDKERMYADYDSTLIYDPHNINVLNNYAYFLSLENRDLNRALEMSAVTLEIEPLNATYLDTYAWILFKMKRYREALTYMEKALRYIENDIAEIYEHYGDVLYMCGEKEKALENWHRAVQLNGNSPALEQKIKLERYVE